MLPRAFLRSSVTAVGMHLILSTVRSILGGGLCGFLLWQYLVLVYPNGTTRWDAGETGLWAITLFFAPWLLLGWSLLAVQRWRIQHFRWVRRCIWLHYVGTLLFTLAHCVSLPGQSWQNPGYGLLASMGGMADLAILVLTPSGSSDADTLRTFRNSMLTLAGGSLIVLWVWSLGNILLVKWQAEKLAGVHPYCLQLGGEGRQAFDYRQAASLFDLSGLRMRVLYTNAGGSTDFQWTFHAMLVVVKDSAFEYWNWSYKRGNFVLITDASRQALSIPAMPTCRPSVGFVGSLPFFLNE